MATKKKCRGATKEGRQGVDPHLVGRRIAEQRGAMRLEQTELAKRIGIAQSNVSAWETGAKVPTLRYLIAIALELETSVDYLVGVDLEKKQRRRTQPDEETPVPGSAVVPSSPRPASG